MASRKPADPTGDAIRALRATHDDTAVGTQRLRVALARSEPRLIAAASRLARGTEHASLLPDLVATFDRLVAAGQRADGNCVAKEEVIRALTELGHDDPDVFLRALRVIQYDPSFGGPEETAGGVRAAAATALASTTIDTQRLVEALAPLLFDPSPSVRQDTVRALGASGSWEARMLIEVKVSAGDVEPAVLGECFVELLHSDVTRGLETVTRYLGDVNDALRLQAVCALSECRNPIAVQTLIAHCRMSIRPEEATFLALGRSRHPEAAAFLEDLLANGSTTQQELARKALPSM